MTIAEFNPKTYLNSIKVLKFRTALARLCVSSHRLEIEAERWVKPRTPVGEKNVVFVIKQKMNIILCWNVSYIII